MQGTTRSVEVVEGVASKAMASGRTMLLSVSAGGKSGRGGRFKQKSLPGGHSTASSTIKKKKVCSSSLNESAKLADTVAGLVAMKEEKERIDDHFVCDPSMVEAALTLQEISMKPAINFPWPTSTELSSGHQSLFLLSRCGQPGSGDLVGLNRWRIRAMKAPTK